MENIIDKLGCAYNKNYKMKNKEQEEIRRPDKLLELYLTAQKQLMNLMAMPELDHIKQEMLEAINQAINQVINQAITNLEQKETLGKHTSLTGKEKRFRNSPDYSPTFAEEPSADPPSLKETYSMLSSAYKFQPTDKQVILYLQEKHSNPCQTLSGSRIKDCTDLYDTQPEHLPDANSIKEKEALYFYVPTKQKSGTRKRKIGNNGFWRASGNKNILSENVSEIGYRRTLKYFEYPDDDDKKFSKFAKSTNWMMHEYRLATTTGLQSHEESLEHWTICKITWTGKNIEVSNDFNREGSIGPSEKKHKNELTMHTQMEGDPKISKIVDSKQEEIAQTNYHSIGDKRMNREIHQSEEISPSYAFGIHPTPNIMASTHEVEPQRFRNPGGISGEIEPSTSFPEQTCASSWHLLNNSKSTGTEDGIQSRNPSCPEENLTTLDLLRTIDFSLYPDFTEGNMDFSYGTLPGQNPTSQLLSDVLCSDSTWSKDQNQPLYPDFTEGNMESIYGTLPGQNPTSQLPSDRFLCSDSSRSKDQNQSLFYPLPTANHPGMEQENLHEANLLDNLK